MIETFVIVFLVLFLFCIIGYFVSTEKQYLQLTGESSSAGNTVNGCGTWMYGGKVLDKEQLQIYGIDILEHEKYYYLKLNEEQEEYLNIKEPIVKFKTVFVALFFIPFVPLKTQIVIKKDNDEFYLFPTEMYWKQSFSVLSFTYFGLFLIFLLWYLWS